MAHLRVGLATRFLASGSKCFSKLKGAPNLTGCRNRPSVEPHRCQQSAHPSPRASRDRQQPSPAVRPAHGQPLPAAPRVRRSSGKRATGTFLIPHHPPGRRGLRPHRGVCGPCQSFRNAYSRFACARAPANRTWRRATGAIPVGPLGTTVRHWRRPLICDN